MLTIPLLHGRVRGRRAAVPVARTAAVAVAAALAAAGLLTACGSAHAPQQAASSASGSRTQEADSAPSPNTGQSTLPGTGSLTVCPSGTLKVALDTSQAGGAAGSAYYPVDFTNTSDAPCAMYGYPGLSFVTVGRQRRRPDRGGGPGEPVLREAGRPGVQRRCRARLAPGRGGGQLPGFDLPPGDRARAAGVPAG